MNWRWLRLDYTDPALPMTRAERRQVWWNAHDLSRGLSHPSVGLRAPRIVRLLYPAIPGAGMLAGNLITAALFPTHVMLRFVGVAVGGLLVWALMAFVGKWVWRPHVNQALREMGYDVCGWCGYWLRGLDSTTIKCPECARDRVALPPHPPVLDQRTH